MGLAWHSRNTGFYPQYCRKPSRDGACLFIPALRRWRQEDLKSKITDLKPIRKGERVLAALHARFDESLACRDLVPGQDRFSSLHVTPCCDGHHHPPLLWRS